MKQEIKEKWLRALKGEGEFKDKPYRKGTKRLKSFDGTFCCLGVLCDITKEETGGFWDVDNTFNLGLKEPQDPFEMGRYFYRGELDKHEVPLINKNDRYETWKEVIEYIEKNL